MWHVVSVIGVLQVIASSRRSRTVLQDPLSRASVAAHVTARKRESHPTGHPVLRFAKLATNDDDHRSELASMLPNSPRCQTRNKGILFVDDGFNTLRLLH
jgi:hypothetical protein